MTPARLPFAKGVFYLLLLVIVAVPLVSCGNEEDSQSNSSPITIRGTPISAEEVDRGSSLYQANCLSCHGGSNGGNLRDIPPPHNANGHTWHHPDQLLTDMILNGISFSLEEQKMPAFKGTLTEQDVTAILAYIKTWWTSEQRAHQEKITQEFGE